MNPIQRLAALSLCGAAALLCGGEAAAQEPPYPSRPIHIVVPYPPGGSTDLIARTLATHLSTRLGQPVVVENVPGAAGEVGVATVTRKPADGYTLLVTPNGAISTGRFFKKQPYDALTDLAPIAMTAEIHSVLAVNAQLPVATLQQFIAYAKARPSVLSYSNNGTASAHYLFSEILQFNSGIKMIPVPYRGASPAAVAVAAGEVAAGVSDLLSFTPLRSAGKVKILATFNRKPPAGMPDVPAVSDIVPGMKPMVSWIGVFAPARTPAAVISLLHAQVSAILALPQVRETFEKAGGDPPPPMTREQFSAFIVDEVETLGRQISSAGIKLD